MSSFFNHTPDQQISISDGVNTLPFVSLSLFQTWEPSYSLPSPFITHYYNPTSEINSYSDGSNQTNGPIPWTQGDVYIANAATYLANYNTPTLSAAKQTRIGLLIGYAQTIQLGGINLFASTFPSSSVSPDALLSYELAGVTPTGFYVKDIYDNEPLFSLAQLQQLNDGIVQLYLLCSQNVDAILEAINSCTTIEQVLAIDYTAGFPASPYTPT